MHACSSSRSIFRPLLAVVVGCLVAGSSIGCETRSDEDRGREALKKIQEAIPDVEALALEQKVDPGVVEEAQRQLSAIKEYQGEIDGKLDSVTVNAIQAFQRANGLRDDGLLTSRTREKLKAAADKAGSPAKAAG